MRKVNWMLEENTFIEDLNPISKEIESQGMIPHQISYNPINNFSKINVKDSDCIISCGSLHTISRIQRRQPRIPGTFANFKNFECSTYYAYYGNYLLNTNYVMLPLSEAIRNFEFFTKIFGRMFIRPNSGFKQFTGQEFVLNTFQNNRFGPDDMLVVISPFKEITEEIRFFCTKEGVITGSTYGNIQNRVDCSDPKYSIPVLFTNKVLQKVNWKPDSIFFMDIAMIHNLPSLLELNSFSCSGWYSCDPKLIIQEASKFALEEYNELN